MTDESAVTIIAGRYQLGERLARGGMGTVFYGRDQQTNEQVAIKRLDWDQIADEAHLLQRFVREGELLAGLAHPNIVRLLTSCKEADHYYLVMELVKGGTLRDLMAKSHPLAIDHILDLALQMADALAFAHQHQIVHRDIKPTNVLLTHDGQVRLTDFGCALLLNASHALTSTGLVIGTLNYLSPEACRGQRQDARADLWSFGVMLYEMLTGTLPFRGDSMVAVINAILSQPTPDPVAQRPDIPKPLADLIRRLLVKDREQRLTNASQLIAILKSIQQGDARPPDLSAYSAIAKPQSRLPAQSTSFVGRDCEIEAFANLLTTQDCRLLTLIGPGGIGKTRLSIEIARSVMPAFPNGVYFVSLAPLDSPHLIPSAIAEALQFTFYGGVEGAKPPDPVTQLANYLEQKTALLVLDNFEHLLGGVDIVVQLLAGAPGLKIMVTSREVLNLEGEWRRPVEGLSFPETIDEAQANPTQFSALTLFAERARQIKSDFRLEDHLEAVLAICQLVEGMPLAIELAAGWLWLMPMDEIATEITTGIDFLVSNRRDTTGHHQSLRAVFESSWRLLEPEDQRAFAQLSVFRGGFLRNAAAAMGIRLPVLSRLVDKSLVAVPKDGRYGLHELLRQYAEEKLREDESLYQKTCTLHSRHYMEWLARLEPDLKCAHQLEALKAIDKELDNIRAAWNWAVKIEAWSEIKAACWSVVEYGYSYGRANETKDFFDNTISLLQSYVLTDEILILLGLLLSFRAYLESDLALDVLLINSYTKRAVAHVRDFGMDFDIARILVYSITMNERAVEDVSTCLRILNECLDYFQDIDARYEQAVTLWVLGCNTSGLVNPVEGVRLIEEELALLKELGEIALRARHHCNFCGLIGTDNLRSLEHLEMGVFLWNEIGNRYQLSLAFNHIAIYFLHNTPKKAEEYGLRAVAIGREFASIWHISSALDTLAEAYLAQGDIAAARRLHLERLDFVEQRGLDGHAVYALVQLGRLAQLESNLEEAVGYYHQARALCHKNSWTVAEIFSLSHVILMWLEQTPPTLELANAEWAELQHDLEVLYNPNGKVWLVMIQAHRLAAHGHIAQATELCGLIINNPFNQLRSPEFSPTTKERAELLLQRLQADLSPDVVDAALQRGTALDLDEVFQSLMT